VQDRTEPERAGLKAAPLIRNKGMMVDAAPSTEAMRTPEAPPAPASKVSEGKPVIPEFPDVMPKVPVTLGEGRKRPISSSEAMKAPEAPKAASVRVSEGKSVIPEFPDVKPKAPVTLDDGGKRPIVSAPGPAAQPSRPAEASVQTAPVPTIAKEEPAIARTKSKEAPVRAAEKSVVDPAEIEKARRFARLIVSDIALYNQDIVAEGLRKGTFFDLLQDDITEGRSLYDNRVPEAVRGTKDYYQEAFDDFIGAQKKQR
jgi:hypothetical protein